VGPASYAVFSCASWESFSTSRRTEPGSLGMSPYSTTEPSGSATATAILCLLTSRPTHRIGWDMGLASNDVALLGVSFAHLSNPRCSLRRPFFRTGRRLPS
jgi:hypothetical protein